MRLLRINGEDVDIDNLTAIGITLQAYDVKEPSKRKLNVSNSFTLPRTAKNNRIFGYASSPYSTSSIVYDQLRAEYWINQNKLVKDGIVNLESISTRFTIHLVDKISVWDELKLITWDDFVTQFVEWQNYQVESSFDLLVKKYIDANEPILLPLYMGNSYRLLDKASNSYVENIDNIWLQYGETNGGHFCIYYKAIFDFIKFKFGIDFNTNGDEFLYNLFADPFASKAYTPIRSLNIRKVYNSLTGLVEGFKIDKVGSKFSPLEDSEDKKEKTLYDAIVVFFQHFNVMMDENLSDNIKLYRWDDLNYADIEDWSKKISDKEITFKPSISGFAQNSKIKFASIYENGLPETSQRILTCKNKNIDFENELFSINAYIPSLIQVNGGFIPDLSEAKSFETFELFVTGYESIEVLQRTTSAVAVLFKDSGSDAIETSLNYLQIPSIYGIGQEYRLLDDALKYPVFYEAQFWLTAYDIINLKFFKQYYIDRLGGSFFINKISGFNPEKANTPTKVELLQIGTKIPLSPPDTEYYVDGKGEGFTDGLGDLFY